MQRIKIFPKLNSPLYVNKESELIHNEFKATLPYKPMSFIDYRRSKGCYLLDSADNVLMDLRHSSPPLGYNSTRMTSNRKNDISYDMYTRNSSSIFDDTAVANIQKYLIKSLPKDLNQIALSSSHRQSLQMLQLMLGQDNIVLLKNHRNVLYEYPIIKEIDSIEELESLQYLIINPISVNSLYRKI